MDRWDVLMILSAGYVAVVSLVRLMAVRRNQVLEHFKQEIEQQLGSADKQSEDKNRDAA